MAHKARVSFDFIASDKLPKSKNEIFMTKEDNGMKLLTEVVKTSVVLGL